MTFITYAGSKEKIISQLEPVFNLSKKNIFVDLFCGGGSVSSYAANSGKFQTVIMNDVNTELINSIKECSKMKRAMTDQQFYDFISREIVCPENKEEYHRMRSEFNSYSGPDRWKKFISMAACCTNNLIRYNKSMEFNQTYGERKINDHYIQRMTEYCNSIKEKNIIFSSESFRNFHCESSALYYMDPPYSNSGVTYTAWNKNDDEELATYASSLAENGNDVIVSSFVKNNEYSVLEQKLLENGFTQKNLEQSYLKGARIKSSSYQEILLYKIAI